MMTRRILKPAALVALCTLGAAALSQEDDIFSFIPEGGRSLLETAAMNGLPADFETAIGVDTGGAPFWRDKIDDIAGSAPAIAAMDDWRRDTLAAYLAARAPLPDFTDLPRDGRDMTLELCQSCHIVTVVVTQDRTREAWLGTMNSPSHIEIKSTPKERQLLADYLVINAGIPIDLIPPALRAGGASY